MKKRSLILASLFAGAVLAIPVQTNAEEKSVDDLTKELENAEKKIDDTLSSEENMEKALEDIKYVNKKTLDGNKQEAEKYESMAKTATEAYNDAKESVKKVETEAIPDLVETGYIESGSLNKEKEDAYKKVDALTDAQVDTAVKEAKESYNKYFDYAAYQALMGVDTTTKDNFNNAATGVATAEENLTKAECELDYYSEASLADKTSYVSKRGEESKLEAELEMAEAKKAVAEEEKAQAELMSDSLDSLKEVSTALALIQEKKAALEHAKTVQESAMNDAKVSLEGKSVTIVGDLGKLAASSYMKQKDVSGGDASTNVTNRANLEEATDAYIKAKLEYDSTTALLKTTTENEKILAATVDVLPYLSSSELQDLQDTINGRKNKAAATITEAETAISSKTNAIADIESQLTSIRSNASNYDSLLKGKETTVANNKTAVTTAKQNYETAKSSYNTALASSLKSNSTVNGMLNYSSSTNYTTIDSIAAHYGVTGTYSATSLSSAIKTQYDKNKITGVEITDQSKASSASSLSQTAKNNIKQAEAIKTLKDSSKLNDSLTYLEKKKDRAVKAATSARSAYNEMKKKSDEMASKTTITWGAKATSNAGSGAASGTSTGRTSMNQLNTNEKAAANLAIKKSVANLNVMVSKFGQATVVDKSTFDFDSIAQSKNLVLLQALKLTTTSKDAEIDEAGMMWMQMDATAIPSNVKVYYLDKNGKLEEASVSYTKNGKVVKFRVPPKSTVAFMASVDDVVNSSNKIVDSDKITPVAKKQKLTL